MYRFFYANECQVLVVHCGSRWDCYCCYMKYFLILNQCMKRGEVKLLPVLDSQTIKCWIFIYSESLTGSCSMNHWINKSFDNQWLCSISASYVHCLSSQPVRKQGHFQTSKQKKPIWSSALKRQNFIIPVLTQSTTVIGHFTDYSRLKKK